MTNQFSGFIRNSLDGLTSHNVSNYAGQDSDENWELSIGLI